MFKILLKKSLHDKVTLMKIFAPNVAKNVKPGQFIILRTTKQGERIPLTVADSDPIEKTITIIFQVVGATTKILNEMKEGESLNDLVGPLGRPSKLDNLKKVAVIGGGVGCAIAYPIVKYLHNKNTTVHTIIGFRTKNLIILKDELEKISNKLIITTDDGSFGEKAVVTDALSNLIENGEKYDEVFAIGPLIMMKFVSLLTKKYNIKTTVSMNPIMIDGTGMCGGCRLTVGNEIKFACVDGPDFDGHLVNFDETIKRNLMYEKLEKKAYDDVCNLLKGEK